MLSISADGGKEGILWAAIHATGDSWHESRPGILHAYDADNISHELWNSLEDPARDDCNNYSKMAPPTIANGKVYLASFGTENIGTGQFCVYGLLPDGPPPSTPDGLRASVQDGVVSLSWNAVAGARTYNVTSRDNGMGEARTLATGLVTTAFTGITPYKGASVYVVTAVNSNGESAPSKPATVDLDHAAAVQRSHMPMH
jgi:hypothetical protein